MTPESGVILWPPSAKQFDGRAARPSARRSGGKPKARQGVRPTSGRISPGGSALVDTCDQLVVYEENTVNELFDYIMCPPRYLRNTAALCAIGGGSTLLRPAESLPPRW